MSVLVLRGDARRLPLPDACVDLVVTSPPYFGLRSYTDNGEHYDGQIGSESTPAEWLAALVECTAEWVRVLKPAGSIFVNLGDKFSGAGRGNNDSDRLTNPPEMRAARLHGSNKRQHLGLDMAPAKSLLGLPWRYALACMDELGLILRRDIVWAKPNGLPESVQDRCRPSHEYLFHLVVQPRYYAAVDEIREPHEPDTHHRAGRNGAAASGSGVTHRTFGNTQAFNPLGKLPGSVWSIPSQPLSVPSHLGVDHFAAFPLELPRRVILGWSPPGVCTRCGEGRRPVMDKTLGPPTWQRINHNNGPRTAARLTEGQRDRSLRAFEPETRGSFYGAITGYACACPQPDAPTTPAVVLDPFAGTGTTLLAAAALGRVGIGCDLSADYCRLARWRTRDRGEIAKAMQVPKPPPVPDGQEALFT